MSKIDIDKIKFFDPASMKQDIEGSYLDQMLEGKPIWPKRDIPGWKKPVRFRVISSGQESRCHAEARRYVSEELKLDPKENEDLAQADTALRILYQVLITVDSTPDNLEHLARDFESFRDSQAITDELVTLMWDMYREIKQNQSPRLAQLSTDVLAKYLDDLKKNHNMTSMDRWPRQWLMDLIDFMVLLVPEDSTGSSSNISDT